MPDGELDLATIGETVAKLIRDGHREAAMSLMLQIIMQVLLEWRLGHIARRERVARERREHEQARIERLYPSC